MMYIAVPLPGVNSGISDAEEGLQRVLLLREQNPRLRDQIIAEVRLDHIKDLGRRGVKRLVEYGGFPKIITDRHPKERPPNEREINVVSEKIRTARLQTAADCISRLPSHQQKGYSLDVEYLFNPNLDVDPKLLTISLHDFVETPDGLEGCVFQMAREHPKSKLKAAVRVDSAEGIARLGELTRGLVESGRTATILPMSNGTPEMDHEVEIYRLDAHKNGNHVGYGSDGEKSAPGQTTALELIRARDS